MQYEWWQPASLRLVVIQNSEKKKTAPIFKQKNLKFEYSLVGASPKYDVIVTSLPESGPEPVPFIYYYAYWYQSVNQSINQELYRVVQVI